MCAPTFNGGEGWQQSWRFGDRARQSPLVSFFGIPTIASLSLHPRSSFFAYRLEALFQRATTALWDFLKKRRCATGMLLKSTSRFFAYHPKLKKALGISWIQDGQRCFYVYAHLGWYLWVELGFGKVP